MPERRLGKAANVAFDSYLRVLRGVMFHNQGLTMAHCAVSHSLTASCISNVMVVAAAAVV